MPATATQYLTIAEMASRLQVPRHRIVFIIESRHIAHDVELGGVRGYTVQAERSINEALQAIAARR